MGIQGLLTFLDKSSTRIHISEFKGQCIAVDAYCWLHKGAYTCADKLARGEKCDAYIFYCMKYVNLLLSHNIKPILVFDGRHLPAKAGTEKKRRESRETNRKTAIDLMNAGRNDEARNFFRRCVDVTHSMALALIQECRKNNVDCIVAPYEADAQLAYLNLQNIAQVVVTEDSDLVLFGCSKVIFKLDMQGGGMLVDRDRLHLSMKVRAENFNFDSFRYMCILSGCDYLSSLPGIGLAKALKFISKTRDPEIHRALKRLPSYLNMTLSVSDEYRDEFLRADATFRYQPVFDPRSRTVVPLTEPPEGEEIPQIVDEKFPPSVALDLALGNLDPFSLQRMDSFNPDCPYKGIRSLQKRNWSSSASSKHPSIWSQNCGSFKPKSEEDQLCSENQKNAIFDMISMKTPKRPIESDEIVLPSAVELVSMYGDKRMSPGKKKHCPSKSIPDEEVVGDRERDTQCNSLLVDIPEDPPSPVLSNRKSVNPFVKQKVSQVKDIGPVGTITHPNFFSALRKFDGYIPTKIDSKKIVVSRYFRICKDTDNKLKNCSGNKDVLQEVSATSVMDTRNEVEEDILIAGYSSGKENIKEKSLLPQKSVLETIADIQEETSCKVPKSSQDEGPGSSADMIPVVEEKSDLQKMNEVASSSFNWSQFASHKSLQKFKCSQNGGKTGNNVDRGSVLETPEGMRDKLPKERLKTGGVMDSTDVSSVLKEENTHSSNINESTSSAFDWSRFIAPKSLSLPKFSSSRTANKTFKNPFRKQVPSKGLTNSAVNVKSFLKISVTTQEKDSNRMRDDERSSSPDANTSSDDIFKSQELRFAEDYSVRDPLGKELSPSPQNSEVSKEQKSFAPEDKDVFNSGKDSAYGSLSNSSLCSFQNNASAGNCSDAIDEKIRQPSKELGPSEDYLWELRKDGEEDEEVIFHSPDAKCSSVPEKKNSGVRDPLAGVRRGIMKGKSPRGIPGARRFGLSRGSSSSSSSQKQNLMTQYGFCKR